MTRIQLACLAALSLFATGLVLTSASGGGFDGDPAALVAERKPVTVGGAPAAAAGEPVAADEDGAAAGGGAPDELGTFGGGGAVEEPVAASPAEQVAPAGEDGGEAGGDGGGSGRGGEQPAEDAPQPTKVRHVFVIALAGHGFDATFGAGSPATYLNGTLRPQGVLLEGYRSLGRADLPDYLAMVGGQPPNADTRADCPLFREIPPSVSPSRSGEIAADGCVYPNTVTTLGDQLTSSRRSWRAYVEDLEKAPPAVAAPSAPAGVPTCRHPASNGPDDTLRGRVGDGYATRHNPFVYFHSLLDLGDCQANDLPLSALERDLASARATPSYSFIAPNLCNDGSESPCADGSPGGLAAADAFLATWVPRILDAPAYRADGLLIVAFAGSADDAPLDPAAAAGPAAAQAPVRNGALLVSRFAHAGTTAGGAYDPYSLLRSVEDLFALKPLARAASARSFASTVLGDAFVEAPSDG